MKKILACGLAIVMLTIFATQSVVFAGKYGKVDSTYTVKIGDKTLPFSDYPVGSYFTDNGGPCTYHPGTGKEGDNRPTYCSNCKDTYGSKSLHASQCFGFARMVFYRLFGILGHDTEDKGKFIDVVKDVPGSSYTQDGLKELFTNGKVKPGAHIRVSGPHSLVFMGCDDSYFYTYEANVDYYCGVAVRKRTWAEATEYFGGRTIYYIRMPLPQNYPGFDLTEYDGYLYKSADNDTSGEYPGKWINETASTGGKVVGGIPYGEYVVVTKYSSDNKFGFVNYKGAEGWVYIYEKLFPYQGPYTCPVVTFNANGGSVSTGSKKVYINTPYGTLPTPTRSGYIFDGWYTSANGGTRITSSTNVTLTANQTLYAHWSIEECSHSYKTYTESTHPHEKYKKCTKCGEIVGLGTVYDDDCEECNPKPKTYTITYNANGGTGAPSSQVKEHGVDITLSSKIPTREGYVFSCWTDTPWGGPVYLPGEKYKVNEDITFYALWDKDVCSHSYKTYTESEHPHEKYKKCTNCGEIVDLGTVYDDDCEVCHPKWEVYTISYDANGGENAPNSQIKEINESIKIRNVVPSKDGYTFKGWSVSSDASSVDYYPNDVYSANKDLTLYAVWETYTISETVTTDYQLGQPVKVTIPTFKVRLGGRLITNEYRQYPLIVYNDITYFPMTYYDSRLLGLKTDYSLSTGLKITQNDVEEKEYFEDTTYMRNSGTYTATVASGAIYVNGTRIYNQSEEYPLLLFRDVTYFPLTWRFAVGEFGWTYYFDSVNGLIIDK